MLEEFPCTAPDQQCHQPDRMGAMGGPAGISPLPLREGTDMPEDLKHHNRRGRIRLVKGVQADVSEVFSPALRACHQPPR